MEDLLQTACKDNLLRNINVHRRGSINSPVLKEIQQKQMQRRVGKLTEFTRKILKHASSTFVTNICILRTTVRSGELKTAPL
jgi:septum formation inhibitor MinC